MSIVNPQAPARRSLVLAGGGIRVAYHAGVLLALEEAGLTFRHVDGTSGGIFGTAMIASGITPTDAARRWRRLPLGGFMKPLPLWDYLRWGALPAMGSAAGVRDKIFPGLGIALDRIRTNEEAYFTFNVCNFTRKVVQSVPGPEVTVDHLIAGISLPLFMPAVDIDGESYLDGVWIKDANLTEAYERGAEEVWLVWCIGNTPHYRTGLFHQYVHMIEITANGALFEEIEQLTDRAHREGRPFRLHIIKPEYALPLDPDFVLGKIDADTLINMGYAETKKYLASLAAGSPSTPAVPPTISLTRMLESGPAYHFRQQFRGRMGAHALQINLGLFLRESGPQLYGSVDWDPTTTTSGFDTHIAVSAGVCRGSFRCLVNGQERFVEVQWHPHHPSGATVTIDAQTVTFRQGMSSRLRNGWYAYVIGVEGVFAKAAARRRLRHLFLHEPITTRI
jgi:predicted acylesterase/phospholipase RssA